MTVKKLDQTLGNMRGRYFGIETKQGTRINARVRNVTPKYVVVEDRNGGTDKKLAKKSIKTINFQGELIK